MWVYQPVLAGFSLFASMPASAAHLDVSSSLPVVYLQPMFRQPEVVHVQPRPAYIRPEQKYDGERIKIGATGARTATAMTTITNVAHGRGHQD